MNDLQRYYERNEERLINKWHHYFDIYDRHFSRFRGTEVHVVEFGVWHGGSLQMWKDYFGDKCRIYGVDINPNCKEVEEDRVEVFIGSQADRKFLRQLAKDIPRMDIVIDDGGHTMRQQKRTFQEIYPHVSENGVYLCEDVSTSYWAMYGGWLRLPTTFMEYSKRLIDRLNAWHIEPKWYYFGGLPPFGLKVSEFTRTTNSMSFYDSVVVFEKGRREPPVDSYTGNKMLELYQTPWKKRLSGWAHRRRQRHPGQEGQPLGSDAQKKGE